MNLFPQLLAAAMRLTKTRAEIDATLLHSALLDQRIIAEAAMLAGADRHVDGDHALRGAAYAGNEALTKLLLRHYHLPEDRDVLLDIRRKAEYFEHPKIDQILQRTLAPH